VRTYRQSTPGFIGTMAPKMSSRRDAYAAIHRVLEALPPSHHGYWWTAEGLVATILSSGKVEKVNEEIVARARNHEASAPDPL
jgi:hypothetical protein